MIFKRLLQIAAILAPFPLCFAFFEALMANPHHTKSQAWLTGAGLIVVLGILLALAVVLTIWIEEELEVNDKDKAHR